MSGLINSSLGLMTIMTIMVAFALHSQKIKGLNKIGPALVVILIGIFLSNTGIVPRSAPIYDVIMGNAVYLSIAIMLLDVHLKKIFSLSKQPILAVLFAVLSVCIVSLLAGLVFAPMIEEGWKIAGMFVGTYTGGSSNLTAIGMGLGASSDTFAAANTADYIVGMPTMVLFFALPAILKNSKRFEKFWPYRLSEEDLVDNSGEDKFLGSKQWSIAEIGTLVAIGFAVVWGSTLISKLFPDSMQSSVLILLITTISIILAQFRQVREINGNKDLGLFFALFFLCVIGFSVDLHGFFENTILIALYCASIIFGTLFLHVLLCRIFKINYEYVLISIMAAISDGPTSGVLAATAGWESLVSIGILLGVIGSVLGNYVGIPVAYLLKALIGG